MKILKTILRNLLFKWLKRQGLKARIASLNAAKAEADKVSAQTGKKVLVFYTGKEFKALTKEQIHNAKRAGLFKGMDYAAIEKRAVYVK